MLLQAAVALPFSALLLLGFCQTFAFPVSWKKLQLGAQVSFIGLDLNFQAGVMSLPVEKVLKLIVALHGLLQPDCASVKALESVIGLLRWVMQLYPTRR